MQQQKNIISVFALALRFGCLGVKITTHSPASSLVWCYFPNPKKADEFAFFIRTNKKYFTTCSTYQKGKRGIYKVIKVITPDIINNYKIYFNSLKTLRRKYNSIINGFGCFNSNLTHNKRKVSA